MNPKSPRPVLARLQFVVRKLAEAKRGVTARMIATEYEVNSKTIYRDIDALRQMGVAIDSHHEGYTLHNSICPFCKHNTLSNPSTINTNKP